MSDISKNSNSKASISRRNALKAGAAVGVGAAAFAGPQIGVLGQAPAYAQTCSVEPIIVAGPDRNVSCTSNCIGVFNLLPDTINISYLGSSFSYTVQGCADTDAGWTDGSPSNIDCEVLAVPIVNGVDQPAILIPGPNFCRATGPGSCGAAGYSCNSRYRIEVRCAQVGCL